MYIKETMPKEKTMINKLINMQYLCKTLYRNINHGIIISNLFYKKNSLGEIFNKGAEK